MTLTYGTIVAQLCSDYDSNYGEVNKQLDRMGYNIGMRLVEDFFAKSGTQRCANFRETAETIAKVSPALTDPMRLPVQKLQVHSLGVLEAIDEADAISRLGSRYS